VVTACSAATTADGAFPVETITVGDEEIAVAVASTSDQRSQGLRGVEELDGYQGMVFVFDPARSATFGMRDTLIPLDIWWFDSEGVLIGSTEMQPCVETICVSYGSPGEIGWALETPLGEQDFSVGDVLVVP
jgi:uncharacterized membrane protein (UPF0127 family)